jgi:glycosyltransferase involved in cell wall biosynthesis
MNFIPGEPMITTIMPTYRRPKLLRKAIISVLNQTYPHFQVCVYDNASGDETHDIVTEIAREDPRVKYHCHSENIGGIANYNYGMKKVTSPFFSLLADDNTLLPKFFEDAIYSLNQHPEAILYAGEVVGIHDKTGKRDYNSSHESWDAGLIFPPDGLLNIIEKGLPTAIDGVLFRREVLDSIGVFDPSFNGAIDHDYMMRIARNHIFYRSKSDCVLFLLHDGSWSSKRDLEEMVTTRKKILERWYNDEGLASQNIKQRIKKANKLFAKKVIPSAVFLKCVAGDDRATLSIARKIMMKEVGVSFKPLRAIIIAELANRSHFLKKIIIRILRKRFAL